MARITRDELFMEMVKVVERRSVCHRKQVAAIICMNNRPVSLGYNGPPSGVEHCCSPGDLVCTESIHAEMNAVAWAARSGVSIDGSTMYLSMSPCLSCAKILINSGVKAVVFRELYRDTKGLELLQQHMGSIRQYTDTLND